ncbi:hypothetical protein KJ865_07900, partial [Myxococcota bacterium]|nr:hypothetical protein [Myxococcota bacterium]
LRSRMRIFQFRPLEAAHIRIGVERGIEHLQQRDGTVIEIEIMDQLILFGGGDLRNTLLLLEDVYSFARGPETRVVLTKEALEAAANRLISDYDGGYDAHYDHASAFQKSLRGSSVDGALYWLGKMLEGGEDPMFIARRLVITASEDVGMADPMALLQAQAAMDAIRNIGMPEARLPLTQAVIYIASAPKSNSVISAISKVTATLREGHSYGVPPHLKDSHFSSAASQGSGLGYVYPHTRGSAVITYLPTQIERPDFYMPLSEAENLRMRNLDGFLRNHHNPPTAPDKTLEKKLLDLIAQKSGSPIKTEDFAQEMGLSPAEVYHLLVNLERSGRITIDKWATIEITGE